MKSTELEGIFPSNWATIPLRSIVMFAIGGDWGKLPAKNVSGYTEVKVIRGTDYKTWEDLRAKAASVRMIQNASLLKRKLSFGDIVIEISGGSADQPVGRSIIIDAEALNENYPLVCSNFFRKLHLTQLASPFFINYFFQFSYKKGEYNKMQTETTNLRNLQFESFLNQVIPFPPIDEQTEIADKLDELFTKIKSAQNIINKVPILIKSVKRKILNSAFSGELSKDYRENNKIKRLKINKKTIEDQSKIEVADKSLLNEIPTNWEYALIGEIENFIGSGITPKGKNKYVKKGVPFYRSQNIYPNGLITTDIVYISEEIHNKMHRTQLKPNDILLNITGASIGRTTFLPPDFKEGNVNQHVCIIRLDESIMPEFISLYLNSDIGQKLIFSSQTGVTREGLNYSQVRGLSIPIAPKAEQEIIIRKVKDLFAKIDLFETKYLETKAKLESLPLRLLQDAFKGELVDSDLRTEDTTELNLHIEIERKTFNETMKQNQKTIDKISKKSIKALTLEETLKKNFANKSFYYDQILEYFDADYESAKDNFFDLLKSSKLKYEYDSGKNSFKFSLN